MHARRVEARARVTTDTWTLRRNPSWNDMEHRRTIATSVGATVPAGLRPPARPSGFASRERGARTWRSVAQLDEAFSLERSSETTGKTLSLGKTLSPETRATRWIGVGMSSPEYLTCRQRRETSTKHGPSASSRPSRFASRARKRRRAPSDDDHTTRFGEDQVKLASLSSGVEVALVVSASINWGKRCPHFLAETKGEKEKRIRARRVGRGVAHLALVLRGRRHPRRVDVWALTTRGRTDFASSRHEDRLASFVPARWNARRGSGEEERRR